MHILMLQVIWVEGVGHSRETDEAFVVHVDAEGVVTGHQHVDSQVVFELVDEMRVSHIL